MKGKAKLIRGERDKTYKVFCRNHFWERWKPLLDNSGNQIEFSDFGEFGEKTKIGSFGEFQIQFDKFQGM